MSREGRGGEEEKRTEGKWKEGKGKVGRGRKKIEINLNIYKCRKYKKYYGRWMCHNWNLKTSDIQKNQTHAQLSHVNFKVVISAVKLVPDVYNN